MQSFWLTHGLDTQYGAFHGSIDRQGSPGAGTGKGLVQQARHLYGMCQLYSTDPTAAPAEVGGSGYPAGISFPQASDSGK